MPVVDASVVVDWVAPHTDSALPVIKALERLVAEKAEVLAPPLLKEEVANALLTGIRRGRWTGAAADTAHGLLRDLPVRLIDEPRDLDQAWELSRRHDNHPVYDMVYVALAERRRTRLLTADLALHRRLADTGRLVTPEQFLAADSRAQ